MQDAIKTLKGKSRARRTMWSRRAQEYEMKINSGDPIAIAEVLRDLKRSNDDSEQSYSERQIYQSALERLAREVAAVQRITEVKATAQLEDILGASAAVRTSASVEQPVKAVAAAPAPAPKAASKPKTATKAATKPSAKPAAKSAAKPAAKPVKKAA
jgi:cell division septation protein DedD